MKHPVAPIQQPATSNGMIQVTVSVGYLKLAGTHILVPLTIPVDVPDGCTMLVGWTLCMEHYSQPGAMYLTSQLVIPPAPPDPTGPPSPQPIGPFVGQFIDNTSSVAQESDKTVVLAAGHEQPVNGQVLVRYYCAGPQVGSFFTILRFA